MSFKCKIGLHSWNGCKCSECGKTRDNHHLWEGCKCSKCGKIKNENHVWNGCKCSKCGKIRNEGHFWDGCKCSLCGKSQDENHTLKDCKCIKCGKVQHDWLGAHCLKCDKTRQVYNSYELIIAVFDNNIELVKKLLIGGADPNSKTGHFMMELSRAMRDNDQERINKYSLIDKATSSKLSKDGYYVLSFVRYYSSPFEIIELLLKAKADPKFLDKQSIMNLIPWFFYSNQRNEILESIELLLNNGLPINEVWNYGDQEIDALFLVQTGILKKGNHSYNTTLLKLVFEVLGERNNSKEDLADGIKLVKLLLQFGADPNIVLVDNSILVEAIIYDNYQIVEALLQYGAKRLIRDETISSYDFEKSSFIKSKNILELLLVYKNKKNNELEYFEQELPLGDALCSWDPCPCGGFGSNIPKGQGYLFIPDSAVEFRRDCLTDFEFQAKLQRMLNNLPTGSDLVFTDVPVLVCEKGISELDIDPIIAQEDAIHWWKTGMIPLRPSPKRKEKK